MSMTALKAYLGERLLYDEPLSKYTAARLGGAADFLCVVKDSVDDLIEIVTLAWAADLPVHIMGGGANVLVSDQGVRGLVVINHVSEIRTGDWHDGRTVSATSGVSLTVLANKCQTMGYSGFEWAISVPGTIGGAIVNNAGAHGADMAQSIADVVVLEREKGVQLYTVNDLAYGYRTSMLKAREHGSFLVLLTTLILPPDDPKVIKARMETFRNHRKETQPSGASLGSIFKNPEGDYAGRLIESAGLKGYKIGNAMVSPIHANFFINDGGQATATDYFALIKHVQDSVEVQTGIRLEPEIQFVGIW
ncbi:MAG: UDP-N-acetylmuramate dehydrogenase [Aggregatilineales bacterium]